MLSLLQYPPVGFHFDVRIIGKVDALNWKSIKNITTMVVDGKFSEVSGLSFEMQNEPYYEGGENRFAYHLPKAVQYSPLVLSRGLVASYSGLANWITKTMSLGLTNPIELKQILVTLLDEESVPLTSWLFINAYPTKWQVSDMNATQNEIMVETMEFAYHRIEKF